MQDAIDELAQRGGSSLKLDRIYIDQQPTKTAYKAGEVFDPAGMVVRADYSLDGIVLVKGAEIAGYSYPVAPLKAGQNTVTISYAEGGVSKTADVTVSVTKTQVAIPTYSGSLTYNGSAQAPTFTNDPGSLATKTGNVSEINASTSYKTRFDLVNTELYEWSDGSTDYKEVAWSIAKVTPTVVAPTKVADMIYNGSSRALTATAGSTNFGTLQHSTDNSTWSATPPTAVNAGSYTVRYRVVGDNNINDVTSTSIGTVNIAQKEPTLSASPASLTLNPSNPTATATITTDGDGALSVVSNDTKIVTASISNKQVTAQNVNKKNGSTTLTVTLAAGTNYKGKTLSIPITAEKFIPALIDATLAQISEVSKAGTGDTYWDIGDTYPMKLKGTVGTISLDTTLYVYIVHFNMPNNKTEAENNIIWQGFKDAATNGKDVALRDWTNDNPSGGYKTDGTKRFNMNHWGYTNNGGWNGCDLRYDILGATSTQPSDYGQKHTTSCVGYDATADTLTNPVANTVLAAMPADWRGIMRLWTRYIDAVGGGSNTDANVKKTVDAISILAEFEVFGICTWANEYEQNHQVQVNYYKGGNSKIRYAYDSTDQAVDVLEASPRCTNGNYICVVAHNASDEGSYASSAAAYALAPAFKT